MAITVIHTTLGPDITVTGDDMWRNPAVYYGGLDKPNHPVPATNFNACLALEYHRVMPNIKVMLLHYRQKGQI